MTTPTPTNRKQCTMFNHDIPAKITNIDTITSGNKLALVTFHGNVPKDITYATFARAHTPANSTTPTDITLYHFEDNTFSEPIGDATYFARFDRNGRITEKGARLNIYPQSGTYVYDISHPLTPYLLEWADHCVETDALHTTLTESAIAIRLHNGETDIDDLYEIREYVDRIITEEEHARTIKQQLDKRLAEYD